MNRNTGLAIVHIAKKEQGMDEDTYRGFLEEHTGKRSAADFNPVEMRTVVKAFQAQGFKIKGAAVDKDVLIRLIKKLFHQVSRANNEVLALRRRLFKFNHLTDLEQLTIEQLKEVYEDLQRAAYQGARQW